jgi:subtilase family serine protease
MKSALIDCDKSLSVTIILVFLCAVAMVLCSGSGSLAASGKEKNKQTTAPIKKSRERSPAPAAEPPPSTTGASFGAPEMRKDLAVEQVVVSGTDISIGEPFEVTLEVRNHGDSRIAQASYQIALGRNFGVLPLLSGSVSNLAPGGSTLVKRQVTIPLNLNVDVSSGEAYIWGIIDSAKAIAEEDEDNNSAFTTVNVVAVGRPDLTVTTFQLQGGEPEPGALFDVDFTIKNIGAGPSVQSSYRTTFYRYGPVDITSTGVVGEHGYRSDTDPIYSHFYEIYPLAPNETVSGSLRYQLPGGTGWENSGIFYITITIDPSNELREESATNNSREIEFGRAVPD